MKQINDLLRENTESPCYVDVQFPCCLACFPLPHLSAPTRGHFGNVARICVITFVPSGLYLDLMDGGIHFEGYVVFSEPGYGRWGLLMEYF